MTVEAGQVVGLPLTATGTSTFAGTITLEAAGWTGFGTTSSKWYPTTAIVLPSGSTNNSGSSTFYIYTSPTATPGTYPVTLHTISGSLTHDTIVNVAVTANLADYSITMPSAAVTVKAGQSTGISLTATGTGGFSGTITPQALGLASFAYTDSKWSPPAIVLSTNGTGSSTLYLYANSTATPGTYPLTLHTTSGKLSHDLIVNVTVTPNPADYSIGTPNTAVTVEAGQAVTIPLTATSIAGFTGTITPEALGATSIEATNSRWSPTAIVLTTTVSSGSSTFYLYTNSTATPGTYPVTLHTTSGTYSHDTIVNVTVTPNLADYSIATPSTAVTVAVGQSVRLSLTATGTGGFAGTITPQALGLASFAYTSSKWSPSAIVLTTNGTASSSINLYPLPTASPGTYPVTLHTTSGTLWHDVTINVTVTANPADFSIAVPNAAISIQAGHATSITLTATSIDGFSGTITPSAAGLNSFASTVTQWSPTAIMLAANGSASSILYFYASSAATPGTYPVTLHATSGTLSHDLTVNVTVTQ